MKILGIAIVYFSKKYNKVIYTYLNLIELDKCDADNYVKVLQNKLIRKKLNKKGLAAIGTDNASVIVGVNNGEFKRLKTENPSHILIKCVCHSLQLAISMLHLNVCQEIWNF